MLWRGTVLPRTKPPEINTNLRGTAKERAKEALIPWGLSATVAWNTEVFQENPKRLGGYLSASTALHFDTVCCVGKAHKPLALLDESARSKGDKG